MAILQSSQTDRRRRTPCASVLALQALEEQCTENEKMRDKLDELAADLYLAQQEAEKLSAENAGLKQERDASNAVSFLLQILMLLLVHNADCQNHLRHIVYD